MKTEKFFVARVCKWCQSCYRRRYVDWPPEPRKVTTPMVKDVSDSKDMEVWL